MLNCKGDEIISISKQDLQEQTYEYSSLILQLSLKIVIIQINHNKIHLSEDLVWSPAAILEINIIASLQQIKSLNML